MSEKLCSQMKRFNYLTCEINAAYHEASFKLGTSDSVMQVLYTLLSCGESCSIGDIIAAGISKQTVNSALRRLEKDGNIVLEMIDGKKKRVRLTDSGRELAERTAMKIIEIENGIFEQWTQEEADTYMRLTAKYCKMLKEKTKEI